MFARFDPLLKGVGVGEKLLLAQSGGATAVINGSLVGAVEAAKRSGRFEEIVGARNGIDGVLSQSFVDLGRQSDTLLSLLRRTPSAALGTTRHKLNDNDARQALDVLRARQIHAFAYIGGNDSADTALRLGALARDAGYPLRVVSIPKTIDNDLHGTDHCPGYGSIARFLALATRDAGLDTEATRDLYPVKLIEVMGRHAGWVAAATALGQQQPDEAPQLIFFPERPPRDLDQFLQEIQQTWERAGSVVAIVPETLRDARGEPIAGDGVAWVDPFGHQYVPGPGPGLTRAIESKLGLRARFDKPGTIARMYIDSVAETDLAEAVLAGETAVELMLQGISGVMVTLERVSDEPYQVRAGSIALEQVANRERLLPDEFIGPDGRSVTEAFRRYALPLIDGPLPPIARLADLPLR
jgi:ATP-dependent phosphofructokinase / diphosphate-dependent phosphofructokinase